MADKEKITMWSKLSTPTLRDVWDCHSGMSVVQQIHFPNKLKKLSETSLKSEEASHLTHTFSIGNTSNGGFFIVTIVFWGELAKKIMNDVMDMWWDMSDAWWNVSVDMSGGSDVSADVSADVWCEMWLMRVMRMMWYVVVWKFRSMGISYLIFLCVIILWFFWFHYCLTLLFFDSTNFCILILFFFDSTILWRYSSLTLLFFASTIPSFYYFLTLFFVDSTVLWLYYSFTRLFFDFAMSLVYPIF